MATSSLGASRCAGSPGACGIDLLLAGHLHLAYHDDIRSHHKSLKRSVLSVQAGTATSTRRRHEPNAYNWITLSRDLVSVDVRIWNGKEFEIPSNALRADQPHLDSPGTGPSQSAEPPRRFIGRLEKPSSRPSITLGRLSFYENYSLHFESQSLYLFKMTFVSSKDEVSRSSDHPLTNLPRKDLDLITELVLRSGSLKDLADAYGVSYPTIRLRLDRVIERLKAAVEGKQPDPLTELLARLVERGELTVSAQRAVRDTARKQRDKGKTK